MDKTKLVGVVLAVGLISGTLASVPAAWLGYRMGLHSALNHEAALGDTIEIIRAARTIEPGQPLREQDVVVEQIPLRYLPPHPIFPKDLHAYLGASLRVRVVAGAQILSGDFEAPSSKRGEPGAAP